MSDAKKCDRCKRLYDPEDISTFIRVSDSQAWRYSVIRDNHPYKETKVDLCVKCIVKLEKFLNGSDNL